MVGAKMVKFPIARSKIASVRLAALSARTNVVSSGIAAASWRTVHRVPSHPHPSHGGAER